MKYFALIENGIVLEVKEIGDDFDIYIFYPLEYKWVDITGMSPMPDQQWSYDGTDFTPPKIIENIQTKGQVEELRLIAYANPITGIDRYFAEVMSLQAEGFAASSAEVKDTKAKGLARKAEIQALYPYPAE